MELVTALTTGSEAISLGTELAKLVKTLRTKEENPTSLTEMLQRVQIEAVRLIRDFEHRLRTHFENLQDLGLNPNLSIESHLANLRWYNFRSRARLKAFREESFSLHRQLATFIDDVTAVLICNERVEDAKDAFNDAFQTKKELDAIFMNSNTPIKDVFSEMLRISSRVSADLQAA